MAIKSSDQISIVDITDAYSVILTNDSYTFPGSINAAKAGSCTTQILAMCGASQVRILHGTGNGILRTLLRQYLNTMPAVEKFRDEHVQFGGAGITVVDLK